MKSRPSGNSRLTILALTLVCLIVPFCLGYMFYVTSQKSYYTKRNFRVLDSIGTHIRLKVENLATNLINAVSKARTEESKTQAPSPSTQARSPKPPTVNVEVLRKAVHNVDRYGTNLKLETNPLTALPQKPSSPQQQAPVQQKPAPAAPRGEHRARPTPAASPARSGTGSEQRVASKAGQPEGSSDAQPEPLVSMSVKPDKGSFAILLEYRSGHQAAIPPVSSDIEKIISPMVSRYLYDEVNVTNENLFDEVLVAE